MPSSIPLVDVSEKDSATIHPAIDAQAAQKIYVKSTSGRFQHLRRFSLTLLLGMYFAFVWIEVDNAPLIWFDLTLQKFHLFGVIFWPQDFELLAFALIISAFGLFFITALFGRVWCGYTCPQTVWSFMFMWLEEKIEGARHQRIRLDNAPWTPGKALKKTLKHTSWMALALLTGLTFVGYFYPIRVLLQDLTQFAVTDLGTLFWIAFFTLATYINAGWLREKVCIYMCPYARFQSVMFNEKTMIVGYDVHRGEPRGSRSRKADDSTLGDCVNCQLCVQVCPTGIDIRDGLQYECIGCALCIDACDDVMTRLDKPKGLIRYASEVELETGKKTARFDMRAVGYGAFLLLGVAVFTGLLAFRDQAELVVIRDRFGLYHDNGLGDVENHYTLKLINKREQADVFALWVEGLPGARLSQNELRIGPGEVKSFPISIAIDPRALPEVSNVVQLNAQSKSRPEISTQTNSKFLGPKY